MWAKHNRRLSMKKFILIVLSLIILSGCSAKVSLNIDDKNNVTENIYLYESNEVASEAEMTKDEFIDSTYDFYKSEKISSYKNSRKYNDSDFGMEFSKTSNGVCNAFRSSAFSDFFDKLECNEDSDYYEIKAESSLMKCPSDSSDCFFIDEVILDITLPENAISSNADIVENNKYTWKYLKDNDASFNLKIKKYKVINTQYKKEKNKEDGNKNLAIIVVTIVIVLGIISFIFVRKFKKNKLEY